MKAIIGRKVGMSQIFDEKGHVIPVTVIEAGPCVRRSEEDQLRKTVMRLSSLATRTFAKRSCSKPELGHLNKAGVSPKKYLREFDLDNASELELGAIIKADTFEVRRLRGRHRYEQGSRLHRRYQALERQPRSYDPRRRPCPPSRRFHGLHHRPQPYLQGQDRPRPATVWRQVTVQNLEVVKVDPELNMLVDPRRGSPAPRAAWSP